MKPRNPRLQKHLKTIAVAATLAAANSGDKAKATTIGINFTYSYQYDATSPVIVGNMVDTASSATIAGIQAQFWNNMAPLNAYNTSAPISITGATLNTAGASGLTVDYSAANAWHCYNATDNTAQSAYSGYLDDPGQGYSVTIHGLSSLGAGGYTLKVLQGLGGTTVITDPNIGFAGTKIYSGVGTTGTLLVDLPGAIPENFTDPNLNGILGTSISTATLTDDTITIVGDGRNGNLRSTLAGIAISTVAVPESGTGVFLCASAALLVMRRRRSFEGLGRRRKTKT